MKDETPTEKEGKREERWEPHQKMIPEKASTFHLLLHDASFPPPVHLMMPSFSSILLFSSSPAQFGSHGDHQKQLKRGTETRTEGDERETERKGAKSESPCDLHKDFFSPPPPPHLLLLFSPLLVDQIFSLALLHIEHVTRIQPPNTPVFCFIRKEEIRIRRLTSHEKISQTSNLCWDDVQLMSLKWDGMRWF